MVIVKIMGGLGNQMFQYAAGRRLAIRRNTNLKLDLTNYSSGTEKRGPGLEAFSRRYALEAFQICATEASESEIASFRDRHYRATTFSRVVRMVRKICPSFLWKKNHYQERTYRFDAAVMNLPDMTYLLGFWQSPKYFSDIAETIKRDFTLKESTSLDKANKVLDRIRSFGGEVVSLHVRRGDMAHAVEVLQNNKIIHSGPIGIEYIKCAIKQFSPTSQFLVFSDTEFDIEWCRNNIAGSNIHYSLGNNDLEDFVLMSSCEHHIIANSTFSWWAAWLNQKPDKRVIAPRQWSFPGAKFKPVVDTLIPSDWQII
jgi:hypothetical protein